MEPGHVFGTPSYSVDLRFWNDLTGIFSVISNAGIPLQELNLSGNKEVGSKVLAQASRLFGNSLNSLVLSKCISVDKIALAFVGGLSHLQSLDVSDIKYISDEHVERLLSRDLLHLHTLNVSGCSGMTNRIFAAVAATNHRFLSLSAARNLNYTHVGVNEVMLKCENLKYLDVSYCPGIQHLGVIIQVGDPEFGIMQYAGRPLQVLKIDECVNMSEESLDYASGALADLKEFTMPRMKNLTDATVQGLVCGAFHLRVLHIQGCQRVRGEALRTIGTSARALQDLNIANIGKFSPDALRAMLEKCQSLTFLNVSNNMCVTDAVFSEMEVPNSGGQAIFLPKMKRLSLANTSLTGFGVACLAERCSNLEHLNVSGHKYVNDAALSVVAGCCRKLRSFWANDCPALTDAGVTQICYVCKKLEVLHLSSSVHVLDAWGTRYVQFTDAVVEACLDGSRRLRELTFRNQCGIHLASPWLLVEFYKRGGHNFLEKVDLRGADRINLTSAAVVFQQCTELCHVLLSTEATLPGVEAESFWNAAFSGCMYTMAWSGDNASTVAGETFEASIENGRYKSDDGLGAVSSDIFSQELGELAAVEAYRKRNKHRKVDGDGSPVPPPVGGASSLTIGFGDTSVTSVSMTSAGTGNNLAGGLQEGSIASVGSGASTNGAFSVSQRKGLADNGSLAVESHLISIREIGDRDNGLTSPAAKTSNGKVPTPAGYLALTGHAERKSYRYRDFYIRRQLEEQSCARFIQFKYKLWAMWQRFRRKLSARKISNTYKVILERRKMGILIKKMAMENSAKRIQRFFRTSKLPLVKAAVKIQKVYRGHRCKSVLFRKANEDWASVKIQALIRGVLVRISDRFILAQIYLKLPPFWRVIMNSVPKYDAADEAVRKRIFPYQIADAREDVKNTMRHILEDVVTDGVLKPMMPLVVPQPFDKKPYLSVGSGQKIDFYSHVEGVLWNDTAQTTKRALDRKAKQLHRLKYDAQGNDLFKLAERARKNGSTVENMNLLLALKARSEKVEDAPMHQFNISFWPHTTPMRPDDVSTEQHDPMINAFDLANNSREVLFCESCRSRMRIVHCSTCMRGYCFFCAFRTHTDVTRRNHSMKMMEPRIIKIQEPSKSLVYHIDMASHASYDLQYLVKYMRSRAEVQRLQAEKKMAKEYEEQEELRRMQFLRAQGESNDKHTAATEIALLYRVKKARRIVNERRSQVKLEAVTKEVARQKVCWIPFQRLFRQYSTRKWFAEQGVVYKLNRKKKKKRHIRKDDDPEIIPRAKLLARIAYEIRQRRIVGRQKQFEDLIVKYSDLVCTLRVNIQHWLDVEKSLPDEIQSLLEQKELVSEIHEKQSQITAAQKTVLNPDDYEKLEKKLDAVYRRVEVAHMRLENCRNIAWWITTYLRNAYRRLKVIELRVKDTVTRLAWVSQESNSVERIEFHIFKRIDTMISKLGMGMAVDWLQRYGKKVQVHLANLDAQQESLILEETQRLQRDEHVTIEFDSLLEELYQGLRADSHLIAEKLHLDVLSMNDVFPPGSDEALRTSEALLVLKRKITQLNASVIDTIKVALQEKFNDEDDRNSAHYVFPTDNPELTVGQFILITAQMLEPYEHPKNITLTEFLDIYLVQPWLAEQAVGDVRLEELARKAEIEKGKSIEHKKGIETQIADQDAKCIKLRIMVAELQQEIEARSSPPSGEGADPETDLEKEERETMVQVLSSELFKKEGELDVLQEVSDKIRLEIAPLEVKIEDAAVDIASQYAHIKSREDERERLRSVFFETEVAENHALFEQVAKGLADLEVNIKANELNLLVFKAASAHSPFLDRVRNNEISLMERNVLALPLGFPKLLLTECLRAVKPRTVSSTEMILQTHASTRMLFCEENLNILYKYRELFEREEEWMNHFESTVPKFKKAVEIFQEALLSQRRQKAMQVEIEARKKRLEFLRDVRMRALKEEKERILAEAQVKEEAIKKEKANRVPLVKRVAQVAKKAIRGVSDFIRDLRHSAANAMDQEEVRMARTIRKRNAGEDSNMPEGFRKLHICHGNQENEDFAKQQTALEERGIPFYQKFNRSIGNQFFIWYQNTYDNKLMITNVEFASNDPAHPTFKNAALMEKDRWEAYTHHKLSMIIWVKRDVTRIFAIKQFEVSMSEVEENRNTVDGFEKLETCLDTFGLPDVYVWVKKVAKIAHSGAQNTDEIINEVVKVRELLKKNPGDRNMQALMKRLNDKLKKAYDKEVKAIVTNPLRSAVELLSLEPWELEAFMKVFEKIDTKGEGGVDFDQIFEYFEQTPTFYSKEVFYSMDALDEFGKIEFGDFVRSIGTYCFFGKQEILRFMFVYTDKGKKGFITHAEFVTLLNTLNPFDKQRAKRALQELQMIEGKKMEFAEFARLNDEFPNAMYPAFALQDAFRTKILGTDWWFNKLAKYKGVRAKLVAAGSNTDDMAELEMKRFQDDQAKVRRMKERDDQIRNESSGIRKALLQAQQFVDEFS